jgi:hypothetical protein
VCRKQRVFVVAHLRKATVDGQPEQKNRSTLVRGVLLRGDDERLLRKAIEMALNGDAQILKFFLGRILPR